MNWFYGRMKNVYPCWCSARQMSWESEVEVIERDVLSHVRVRTNNRFNRDTLIEGGPRFEPRIHTYGSVALSDVARDLARKTMRNGRQAYVRLLLLVVPRGNCLFGSVRTISHKARILMSL